jgi:hypothetical protein
MTEQELPNFAAALRARGLDAERDYQSDPTGLQAGLRVGKFFYPLWELNRRENRFALESYDFDAIRSRRGPGWTIGGEST